MKVSIIGGGGRVGSNTAFALQCAGVVRSIALVDASPDLAGGEALDLIHGSSLIADQKITSCDLPGAADSEIVVITAGARRKPEESRLDLINRNVSIFKSVLDGLKAANLNSEAIILVVSNPVDILTRLAVDYLKWPASKVIGLGTVLDTARFQSFIAEAKSLPPTQVEALILGEHGDTMTPIWSSAAVGGIPLAKLLTPSEQAEIFKRTQGSGAEVIKKKGGAGYAVALSIAEVIHSIALDRRRVLPVSTRMNGHYGIKNVCLSIPTIVGRAGAIGYHQPELWPKELQGLANSAKALAATWSQLK